MFALEEKITHYLEDLPPDLLGLQEIGSIEILKMTPGSYNLNFHVRVGQKDIIFRVNTTHIVRSLRLTRCKRRMRSVWL